MNRHRCTVVVVPLSTAPVAHPPITVEVRAGQRKAVAVIDQIHAVTKERFQKKLGILSDDDMDRIETALKTVPRLR